MTSDAGRDGLDALEASVRARCAENDFDGAATLALRGYGGEIYSFLVAVHRDETVATDVFSSFAEGVWLGLPRFEWSSSLRTWLYAVARNRSRMARRDAARRDRRGARVGESALDEIAQAVRTATASYLRTEKRDRLEALREALSPEDRALLILRVEKGLSWNELALVMSDGEPPLDSAAVRREAARLRMRFQRVKERLRELARAGSGS